MYLINKIEPIDTLNAIEMKDSSTLRASVLVSYNMTDVQDYISNDRVGKNGIGIRVRRRESCQVIRQQKGNWIEIGPVYPLPVEKNLLVWTQTGIPSSVLAVALRVYELDNPGTQLRRILTVSGLRPVRDRKSSVVLELEASSAT